MGLDQSSDYWHNGRSSWSGCVWGGRGEGRFASTKISERSIYSWESYRASEAFYTCVVLSFQTVTLDCTEQCLSRPTCVIFRAFSV